MSGLCGWIGLSAGSDARSTVTAMAGGLPAFGACRNDAVALPGAGLASRADLRLGSFRDDADLWTALDGYPTWHDPELAAIACERDPAAALAEAWRRHGPELLDRVGGPVSLAVIDHAADRALVAIDKAGIQPMCYAIPRNGDRSGLVFGSTADAVRGHPAVGSTLRPQAIFDFLYFVDRIPAPQTVYEEQRKLQPGECLIYERGQTRLRTYWQIPYSDAPGDEPAFAAELRTTLSRAVGHCLEDEDPGKVGAYLSGGVDSSSVLGLYSRQSETQAKAFTIAFEDARYDESVFASLAATQFGAAHTVFTVGPEHVAEAMPRIATLYDEPFANSSAVPAYFCAQAAREAGIEVLLAGDGGDELFAGNERYLSDRVYQLYQKVPHLLRRALIEPTCLRLPTESDTALVRKAAKYVRRARMPMPVRVTNSNLYSMVGPRDVFTPETLDIIDPDAPARHVTETFMAAPSRDDLRRFLYLDQRITLADGDLRKVGRTAEMAEVRVRYPMLEDDMLALSARIPPRMLCRRGLRSFYKDAFAELLPAEIRNKPKHGFGLPYLPFLRTHGPLNAMACDGLQGLKKWGWFTDAFLDGMTDDLRRGTSGRFDAIAWDLVTLQMWLESRHAPAVRSPSREAVG